MNNAINTVKTVSPIVVREIKDSQFQKENTTTAVLEQIVTTVSEYASSRISNEFQDNIFSKEEFGIENQKFTTKEKRIAFMLVPKNTTVDQMVENLKKFPKANIYKILSNKPIISDGQEYAIKQGQLTMEQIENRQMVINGDTGEVIKHNGNVQYRATFFSAKGKEDQDLRSNTIERASEVSIVNAIENAEEAVETNEGSFMKTE